MPGIPSAKTRVSDTATAVAQGLKLCCLMAPVLNFADETPRQFGSADAIYTKHGYSEGVEYAALHVEETGLPLLFIGLPIATPGVIGRHNTSGNTGSSVTTVTAGGGGVLAEHDGVLTVIDGGVVGTDQIILGLSLDGGTITKRLRIGTGNSYAIPYFNATIALGAGTLVEGDVIHTWHGTAPLSDATGWAAARAKLAKQQKGFRSLLLCGDLQTHTEAAALLTELNGYETENERFIYGRASVKDRAPLANMSKVSHAMTGAPSLTFADLGSGSGDNVTRSAGSWIADGFAVGDRLTVTGTVSNNGTYSIVAISATVISVGIGVFFTAEVAPNAAVIGHPSIVFAAAGHTVTRNTGSWLDDGFRVGDTPAFSGTVSNNALALPLTAVTALVLTFGSGVTNETIGTDLASVTTGQDKATWMAAITAEFEPIDDAPRIDLSAGRGRVLSPFSGWALRRPAGWAASLREYQHDLQIATWRKSDGPVGFDLFDAENILVEWDDRADGQAGSAGRFTTLRTWSNGPEGAFVTQSLTRATEGSLRQQTHNEAVVNLVQTTVQINVEDAAIGVDLILNDDGTATTDSLATIADRVNTALDLAVLQNRGEGPRASKCVFTPSTDDILNVEESVLTYVVDLNLNGTIHSVDGAVRVRSGGQ